MRLNKHISESGICSRREADAWIAGGRVTVNGVPGALGTQVRPGDDVRVDGQPLPQYASADFRLGDFDATTVGVKYGRQTAGGNEWSLRLEYYQQTGTVPADQIIGNQANREQYPDLSAVIAQFSYRFGR